VRLQTSKIHNLSQKIRGILPNEIDIMEILYCYDIDSGLICMNDDDSELNTLIF
jgi:hypothetical protein